MVFNWRNKISKEQTELGFKPTRFSLKGYTESGGAMRAQPPFWTSVIYEFQGVLRPQQVPSPPCEGKSLSPPPDKFLNTLMVSKFQEYRCTLILFTFAFRFRPDLCLHVEIITNHGLKNKIFIANCLLHSFN